MCNCALCPAHVHPISRKGTGPFYLLSSCKQISQMSNIVGNEEGLPRKRTISSRNSFSNGIHTLNQILQSQLFQLCEVVRWAMLHFLVLVLCVFFFSNGLIFWHAYPLLFFRVSASAGCLARRPTPAIKHLHTRLPVLPSIFIFILIIATGAVIDSKACVPLGNLIIATGEDIQSKACLP